MGGTFSQYVLVVCGGISCAVLQEQPGKAHVTLVVSLVLRALLGRRAHIDMAHALAVHRAAIHGGGIVDLRALREHVDHAQPRLPDLRVGGHAGADLDVAIAVLVRGFVEVDEQRLALLLHVLQVIERLRPRSLPPGIHRPDRRPASAAPGNTRRCAASRPGRPHISGPARLAPDKRPARRPTPRGKWPLPARSRPAPARWHTPWPAYRTSPQSRSLSACSEGGSAIKNGAPPKPRTTPSSSRMSGGPSSTAASLLTAALSVGFWTSSL